MTRIRLRYVQEWVDREGRVHRYFRRPGYPRVPLRGLPGSAEFMAAYQQALDSRPEPIGAARSKAGSVSAAVASFYATSGAFHRLRPTSQQVFRTILEAFRRQHGDMPITL